jgi:homotetrameric cytidine deaminase
VELKARDPDPAATLAAALALDGVEDHGVLVQRDTYLGTHRGRLKLREQDGSPAHLIAYERADEAGARTSRYRIADVSDPGVTLAALEAALGTEVVVEKERRLLLWRGVRIHLDRVPGLGAFVELEAVAAPGSDLTAEHERVASLRAALAIAPQHVEATGYAALLLAQGAATERLVQLAREVRERAHVPYSRFTVGAALRDETGALHAGANVENAAYPEGHCAETSAIAALVARGGTRIEEVAVMADADLITPCGGCRQRLAEFGAAGVPVHLCGPEGIRRTISLGELLPLGFGAQDLPS